MVKNFPTILERVDVIEKNLQELKVDLLWNFFKKEKEIEKYKGENILKEVKKMRKKIWNEKYSKAI